jgi:hypothetical protein
MPKWLRTIAKWAGKTLFNAAVEKGEQIIDKKKTARHPKAQK